MEVLREMGRYPPIGGILSCKGLRGREGEVEKHHHDDVEIGNMVLVSRHLENEAQLMHLIDGRWKFHLRSVGSKPWHAILARNGLYSQVLCYSFI